MFAEGAETKDSGTEKAEQSSTDSNLEQSAGDSGETEQSGETKPAYVYKDYTAEDIDSLEKGKMMREDYTQKTQELAKKEKELAGITEQWGAAISVIQEYDPAVASFLLDGKPLPSKMPSDLSDDEKDAWKLKQEVETLRQDIQKQKVADMLDKGFEKIPGEYDRKAIEKHMLKKNIPDPLTAYNDMEAETLRKEIAEIKEKEKQKEEALKEAKRKQAGEDNLGNAVNNQSSRKTSKIPPESSLSQRAYQVGKTAYVED